MNVQATPINFVDRRSVDLNGLDTQIHACTETPSSEWFPASCGKALTHQVKDTVLDALYKVCAGQPLEQ